MVTVWGPAETGAPPVTAMASLVKLLSTIAVVGLPIDTPSSKGWQASPAGVPLATMTEPDAWSSKVPLKGGLIAIERAFVGVPMPIVALP